MRFHRRIAHLLCCLVLTWCCRHVGGDAPAVTTDRPQEFAKNVSYHKTLPGFHNHVLREGQKCGGASLSPKGNTKDLIAASNKRIASLHSSQCNYPHKELGLQALIHWPRDANASFLHIPKCASSSIARITKSCMNGRPRPWTRETKEHAEQTFHIAFVRDPVSRFTSAFQEMYNRPSMVNFFTENPGSPQDQFELFFDLLHRGNMELIAGVPTHPALGGDIKQHFSSQTHFLCAQGKFEKGVDPSSNPCRPVNYIGEVSTLSEDWQVLCEMNGGIIPCIEIKNARKSTMEKPKFTPAMMSTFCQTYRNDYCCLGFEIPAECPQDLCDSPQVDLFPWM